MARKAKDKRVLFFFFFVSEVAFYFFGLFDVCMKQCRPTVNWNFILLSYSFKKKKEEIMPQRCYVAYTNLKCIYSLSPLKTMFANPWWRWKWSRSVMSHSLQPPWTVAYEAPPFMEFSRKEYWKTAWVCCFHLQGIFLTQGSNPVLPHCKQMLLPSTPGICY